MHRIPIHLAAVAAVTALALAGCAGGGEASGDTVEVTVWHYWDGTNAETFDSLVDEYNETHDGVEVKTSNVPNADFLTKLRASATSNTLPDIAIGDLVWVPQIEQLGSLADLGDLLPEDVLGDINPALTAFGTIGDAQVSVPVSANNLGLIYNKTLFESAGLDPETPPVTWEELRTAGESILEATGKPAYELFTQAGDNGEGLTWNFQVNLWQAGGEFLNSDNSEAAFNTEAGETALQYWVDLIDSGLSRVGPWGELGKSEVASATDGSWMVGIWAPDPPFEFGTGTAPYPEAGEPATNLGGEQAMVFDNGDDTARAAADFLAWFLEPEQVLEWCQTTGMLPVVDSIASSGEYLAWVDENQPRLRPFVEQMAVAHARPNTPLYPAISLAFAQEIERALTGEVSVTEALDNAEQAVNDVIAAG